MRTGQAVGSIGVYRKVAQGELSPPDGAAELVGRRPAPVVRPPWLPRWAWALGALLLIVLLTPFLSKRTSDNPQA